MSPRRRIVVAAAIAFALDFALGFLAARLLPGRLLMLELGGNSFVQPASCLILALCMALGGWIAGRRFLPVAVVLVLVLQLVATGLLVQIAHTTMPHSPLSLVGQMVLRSYALGFGLQLLAAALGALAGAALHRSRPFPLLR